MREWSSLLREWKPTRLQVASLLLGGVCLTFVGFASSIAGFVVQDSARPLGVAFVAWAAAACKGAFHLHITRDDLHVLPSLVVSALSGSGIVLVGEALVIGRVDDPQQFVAIGAIVLVGLTAGVQVGRQLLRVLWTRGEFRTTAIVVGRGSITRELVLELSMRPELGIDVVGHLTLDSDDAEEPSLEELLDAIRPDRLIIGDSPSDDAGILGSLRLAGTLGVRVYVLPRLFTMGLGNGLFAPDRLRGFPLLRVNRSAHPRLSLAAKRAMDIAASFFALVLTAPILFAAGLAVKLSSPGPVLYWQERIGRHGTTIRVPKLRSMTVSETGDSDWTAARRVTRVGRFLRRSAIDELPQLLSVVRGDMSLVGPRPERPLFAERFAVEHHAYEGRLRMRAGLTGLSQIAGLRGDTSIAERTKYDNLYIDQWTLSGDLVILARTLVAIVRERTYARAHVDLEEALSVVDLDAEAPMPDGSAQHSADHTDQVPAHS